ncbi:natural cytotoxicity triggering receptor 3 ligand 1-like [Aquarana catesbeiana]|uniref:natural cytotoxicity triggering receptor 3 ligand 1-like n=1 Tax=Aquarana catesbeiana TaxID=8400 RepID=UPI003CC9427B
MAERTILGIFILLSLLQTYAALDVFAPSPQRAFVTNNTVLNCTFSVDKQPLDFSLLSISWSFQEKVLLRYDSKGFSTQDPRMSFCVESLGDGYASLHISNVTIPDRGTYVCTVIYSTESKKKKTLLKVLARPRIYTLITKDHRNTESILTCKATEFFPPDIWITWYRNEEVLRNELMGKPQMYKDGTYQMDSSMKITSTNEGQKQIFSCRVQHDSLQEPLQMNFQLINEDTETSFNVVTVVYIILGLTAIPVGIGIFLWIRKNAGKMVTHIKTLQIALLSSMKSKSMYIVSLLNIYARCILFFAYKLIYILSQSVNKR